MAAIPKRQKYFIALILASLAYYLRQAPPGLYWLDSGELAVSAAVLGIPHNPGYPLFCMLGHLWLRLCPLGNVAFRLNCLTALLGVGSLLLLARFLHLSVSRQWQWTGVFVFGVSPLFVSQITVCEIYPFNTFALLFLLNLALYVKRRRSTRSLLLFSFTGGIALVNHYSAIMWAPGFGLWLWPVLREQWKPKFLLTAILLVFLSLTIFSYLPCRSTTEPALDWSNTQTFSGFLKHITASEHRSASMPQFTWFQRYLRLKAFALQTGNQLPIAFWPVFFLGLGWMIHRREKWLWLALIGVGNCIYVLYLNVVPLKATGFGLPLLVVIVIFMTRGFAAISELLKRPIFMTLLAALIILAVLVKGTQTYENWAQPENRYPEYYAQSLLATLPLNAVAIVYTDTALFSWLYMNQIECFREDILFLTRNYPEACPISSSLLKQAVDPADITHREINLAVDEEKLAILVPDGLLFSKILPHTYIEKPSIWSMFNLNSYYTNLLKKNLPKNDDAAKEVLATSFNTLGFYEQAHGRISSATKLFERAIVIDPNSPEPHVNLGLIDYENHAYNKALEHFEKALSIDPYYATANLNAGILKHQAGRLIEAEEHYRRVLKITPELISARYNLGMIFWQRGKKELACQYFREVHNANPQYEPASKMCDMCK